MTFLSTLWRYRNLIAHKAWADFRAESERTLLGMWWWLINPIIDTAVYYVAFAVFFQRGGGDYVPFLIIGIVTWGWFASCLVSGSSSILRNAATVRQVAFPKLLFPVIQIAVSTYRFLFSLIVLLATLFLYHYYPTSYWLLVPAIMLVEVLLIAALTLPLCAVVPFVPDLANFIQYTVHLFFFLSCVMIRMEDMGAGVASYIRLNPIALVLNAYRDVLLHQRLPDFASLGTIAGVSVLGIALGAALIGTFDGIYAKRMV